MHDKNKNHLTKSWMSLFFSRIQSLVEWNMAPFRDRVRNITNTLLKTESLIPNKWLWQETHSPFSVLCISILFRLGDWSHLCWLVINMNNKFGVVGCEWLPVIIRYAKSPMRCFLFWGNRTFDSRTLNSRKKKYKFPRGVSVTDEKSPFFSCAMDVDTTYNGVLPSLLDNLSRLDLTLTDYLQNLISQS